MTHYSDKPGHVECNIFREGGKWYQTVMLDMTEIYNHPLMHDAVQELYHKQFGNMCADMWMVILEPYHRNAHPIMQKIEHWAGYDR